jgi:signal transduction histidine kinase
VKWKAIGYQVLGTRYQVPGTRCQVPGIRCQVSGETRNLVPETRNPKPGTRNPKPETWYPKPETWYPKPETRNPKPTPPILFSVADPGRGIPPDKLAAIFERFQQVDASDTRQKGGTGLGLTICKTIVQQHGGEIWVESTLGQGSTFYFTLPGKEERA